MKTTITRAILLAALIALSNGSTVHAEGASPESVYGKGAKPNIIVFYADGPGHRYWIYAHRGPEQLIRGKNVMKDGRDKWWDVTGKPDDLINYKQINDWHGVSESHRNEKEKLEAILPLFDNYYTEHEAPGVPDQRKKGIDKRYFRRP